MTTSAARDQASGTEQNTGCYIYGLVPADVELAPDAEGLGDPPAQVTLVRHGDIAAIVSEVDVSKPIGRPEDLLVHEQLLDATVSEVPVLPLRFGAVMTDEQAVEDELLAPHHDEFLEALQALEGRAEYVVKARFDEQAILREVLTENPQAVQLRDQIQGQPEDATRDVRMKLGELINQAVDAKRHEATERIVEVVSPQSEQHLVREPTHERDAGHVALLVLQDREEDLRKALDELAERWAGRVDVRLLGPLAAYDFVGQIRPEG